MMHFGSNVGYAIQPLEQLHFEIALKLARGDQERVHFVYPNVSSSAARSGPAANH
jgi:hypothetical protein